MKKATHKEIAEYVNKNVSTINGWRYRNPDLLEIVKLGAFCKKNGLDMEKIQKLVEMQEMISSANLYRKDEK